LSVQKAAHDAADARSANDAPRLSLAERIAQPRVPRGEGGVELLASSNEQARDARTATFLKAVNGGAENAMAEGSDAVVANQDEPSAKPRRARLLERISNIEKPG
ncbi:MAG: hypothetical protein ABL907_19655, partial [Hyphomicrobium sp.]